MRYARLEHEEKLAKKKSPKNVTTFTAATTKAKEQFKNQKEFPFSALISKYGMPGPGWDTVNQFSNFWIRASLDEDKDHCQSAVWDYYARTLWAACPSLNIEIPTQLPHEYRQLLSALYSLREGDVIGLDFDNLRSVENLIFNSYRQYYRYFAFAIRAYKRETDLRALQPGSSCHRHIVAYKKRRQERGFIQNRDLDPLINYLFPELREMQQ